MKSAVFPDDAEASSPSSSLRTIASWHVLLGEFDIGSPRRPGAMTPALRAAYIAAVQREASREHQLEPVVGGFRGRSSSGLGVVFDARGVEVSAGGWRAEATRWGREGALLPVARTAPRADGNRATYHRDGFDEWYVVGPLGIEQGFTLHAPPARTRGGEGIVIELAAIELEARIDSTGTAASLHDATGRELLRYTDLYVVDAAGKELPARLRAETGSLAIWFDDRGATYPVTVDPLIVVREQKLGTSGHAHGDDLGVSMAVSGDTAIIGAPGTASRQGAAHVFVRSGGTWSLLQKLIVNDTTSFDNFGWSVALDGDVAIVGAVGKDAMGAAYVFVRSRGAWSLQQTLAASDGHAGDFFGSSVALSGNTALIGANQKAGLQGAAYFFVRSEKGWSERQKLTGTDTGDQDSFGYSLAISGDTAVVGACGQGYNAGAAYVFVRSGEAWFQQQKLTGSDIVQGDSFGISVALSGDTVIVGAYATANRQGAAYVFVRSGETWSQEQKLVADDWAASDYFGVSLALGEDTAVIGAYGKATYRGAAYVFVRSGGAWFQRQKLTASDARDYDSFGSSVALSEGAALVGASRNANHGAAYAFALREVIASDSETTGEDGAGSVARLRTHVADAG
ncbi:hemagglutinin protein [Labilithrix luteola]|uniref:Hemagglutinin protein n=1 Tax=Labilithrix luteola TaxID=1391654 RepID=A0A0K1PZ16_9BACT|nr:FG-GAP repeat protein [Labilithrix luteola]AKU98770.1 hemagglutinin protein [Labilithrix luteola]